MHFEQETFHHSQQKRYQWKNENIRYRRFLFQLYNFFYDIAVFKQQIEICSLYDISNGIQLQVGAVFFYQKN